MLVELFDKLNNKIKYVIFKSRYSYCKGYPENDIDILIDAIDFCIMFDLLNDFGFLWREQNLSYPYMDFFVNSENGVMMHIHYKLVIKIKNKFLFLPFEEYALKTRQYDSDKNLYFLCTRLELFIQISISLLDESIVISFLRIFIKNRAFGKKRMSRIDYLLNNNVEYRERQLTKKEVGFDSNIKKIGKVDSFYKCINIKNNLKLVS